MDVQGCPLPEDLLYDLEQDVWVRRSPTGDHLVIGMMAPMASFAGRFTAFRFRALEGPVRRGQSLATAESVRYTGAFRMPVDGVIIERNEELSRRPKLLNDSTYDRGWVARVHLFPPGPLPSTLRSAAEVREEVRRRIEEMRIRCYPAAPDAEVIQIGSECSAVLAALDEEVGHRGPEEVVLLVSDDPLIPVEIVRWEDRTGHKVLYHDREGTLHHLLIRKEAHPVPRSRGIG